LYIKGKIMLTVKEWMELVEYRITEGSDYGWGCFGPRTYSMSSWNGDQDGHSFNITFDTGDQTVYAVEVCDYKHSRAYRIINPDYQKAYRKEATELDAPADQAWDDINFVDLEADDDFIQKSLAIRAGEDYDTRVTIPLDIPEDELMVLFKAAHERDMTFNEFVEQAIRAVLVEFEKDSTTFTANATVTLEEIKEKKSKKSKKSKKKDTDAMSIV
jgi:hypothetical protein